ncbi:MAG: GTP-binding protein [Promethearchaeota archaeon]|nr:MAG: GTP-binding protein [Candidatus Lokiarchaeota archaeon]
MKVGINTSQDLKPKITIIGHPGVGKTTIKNLIRTEEIPLKYTPSLEGDIATIKIGKYSFSIWDYTGTEQFSFLWEQFIKDSDLVLIITDSTLENVEKSKFFIEIIKNQTPSPHTAVIANKQDLEEKLNPEEIERILGLKTYSMIAIDPMNKEKMIRIIVNLLDMEDEIYQQLISLEEKNKWILELEKSLEDEDHIKALYITKKLRSICKELGDESLENKFNELAQKLNETIKHELKRKEISISDEMKQDQEIKPEKESHTAKLLKELIGNYMKDIKSLMAVVIFDRNGLIIASESKIKSGDILEIGANVIKMPKIIDFSKNIEKHPIRVICPTCKQNKTIFVPKSIVKDAENVVTFSIPNNLVCEHQFQIFVDRNFAIRGYQRVDYEIDSYMDRIIKEVGMENEFFNITVTSDKKVAYCSMGPNSIVTSIAEPSASDVELKVYSEYIAGKVELMLEGNENIDVEIPQITKTIAKTRGGELPRGDFYNKIIMTGNHQVGKTSLVSKFVRNLFPENTQPTIGVDLSEKVVKINDKTSVKFLIWDIGGQITQMAPYRKRFYEGANSAFIVLDRTRLEALKSIEIWYNDIKKYVPDDINIIVIGNKTDLTDQIKVSEHEIKNVAEQYGFHYILTSAKTGENVNDAFLYMAYKSLELV